jgi:signal transduction histidine kinase
MSGTAIPSPDQLDYNSDSANDLRSLVSNLLDISKIEGARPSLTLGTLDLRKLIVELFN